MTTAKEEFPELFDPDNFNFSLLDLVNDYPGDAARGELIATAKMLFRVLHSADPKQEITEVLKELINPVIDPTLDNVQDANGEISHEKCSKRIMRNRDFLCEWTGAKYVCNQMRAPDNKSHTLPDQR
jgi:hypothetical protein